MEYEVSEIVYYPVKSMNAISVPEIALDQFGIQNDRRFMLIDQYSKFVSQRTLAKLSQLTASLTTHGLAISGDKLEDTFLPYKQFTHDVNATIWSDVVSVKSIAPSFTEALSQWLGLPVRMVYMQDECIRQVDREFFKFDQNVSFADAFPILLTNTASLADLNARLEQAIPMSRFRPNIAFSGDIAFQEDEWLEVSIGDVQFNVVKPCSRCGMTTIDANGKKAKEPLKTLAKYRKNDFGVCFGQNLVHRTKGVIKVGDKLIVNKVK